MGSALALYPTPAVVVGATPTYAYLKTGDVIGKFLSFKTNPQEI